ncbi:MAG: demethoxyubiquinone hydroxylase family protein [Gammaproteobacteria bacterium]|nr:demethoxyubiquinone hydroxylase family protein [Gammaproteobacteria bacterium]
MRQLSRADQTIAAFAQRLAIIDGRGPAACRKYPAENPAVPADADERRHAAGLMRVNHVGEICAQALYDGQTATARSERVQILMQQAAAEELDHLDWTRRRIDELGERTSHLTGAFYLASFAAGATAGLLGDRVNLGFLAATEEEVSAHLDRHLEALPASDVGSAAVIAQMQEDEARHAQTAIRAGGAQFSRGLKRLMRGASRIMTSLTYRF